MMTLLITLYWLVGVIAWCAAFTWMEGELSVLSAMTSLFAAFIWPVLLIIPLLARLDNIILWRRK